MHRRCQQQRRSRLAHAGILPAGITHSHRLDNARPLSRHTRKHTRADLVRRTRYSGNVAPECRAQLHSRAPHAARGTRDEHAFALLMQRYLIERSGTARTHRTPHTHRNQAGLRDGAVPHGSVRAPNHSCHQVAPQSGQVKVGGGALARGAPAAAALHVVQDAGSRTNAAVHAAPHRR